MSVIRLQIILGLEISEASTIGFVSQAASSAADFKMQLQDSTMMVSESKRHNNIFI